MTATIIDYGAGNLRSVQNTLDELGASYLVTNQAADVVKAEKLILPGVGNFGQMMQALDALNLRSSIKQRIQEQVPTLGICLGLHSFFESSEESTGQTGFGFFPGQVKRFSGPGRIPHMGWNTIEKTRPSYLLQGLGDAPFTYFAHSFYVPVVQQAAATCSYVQDCTAVLEDGNIFGVQFHPEKSGPVGLRIVQNFLDL